jgi:BolA family transcriptional regulator, general stress-responsive regulator
MQGVIVAETGNRVVVEIADQIKKKLQSLLPAHVELLNESQLHAGPAADSHFKLTLVADQFDGQPAVKRHQAVYKILKEELEGPVHALALHLYTPEEWESEKQVPESPQCAGKNT